MYNIMSYVPILLFLPQDTIVGLQALSMYNIMSYVPTLLFLPQDTIVGLQALSMYNIRSYAEDIDMRCTVSTSDNSTFRTLQLRGHEAMVEKSVHNVSTVSTKSEILWDFRLSMICTFSL
jgi:hypothetical protein